jgi:protocatechuate 3,4-dioxygenase, alpha subunit
VTLARTPSQTVGPFYSIGLCRRPENELVASGVALRGTLFDGAGEPIGDGMIELWDPVGGRWGRCGTDDQGRFTFVVPEARSLNVFVFARGLLRHQFTRVYFSDEQPESLTPAERETLRAVDEGDAFRFDIRMQGDNATVFFAH